MSMTQLKMAPLRAMEGKKREGRAYTAQGICV
ncbi:hypothetical protein AMURIS_04435 [Acetatifactor muris]|uniref:Uncharacterized protein n=1 Tax=Acetatifactor muris TaxID=879566 RepID=A0A2K4ZML9_9FIRM|nr:hypothetical protein AMURIS_04435 [Acetatifactor muris]